MEPERFIQQLEDEVRVHPAVHHPFLKRFATEPLTLEQIQNFGLQHYQLVKVFVTYMTNLLPKFPDGNGNRYFGPIFNDEFGQWTIFRSHAALYRNFLKALGLEEEAWGRVRLLPETAWFIEAHLEITRSKEFLIGLGAIGPGHEFSIPIMFSDLVEGFRRNTRLPEKEMEYFLMHIEEDVAHAKLFNEAIAHYAPDAEGQGKVRQGTLKSLEARKIFWDGLYRVVFAI